MAKAQRMVYQTEETRQHILACAEKFFTERGFFDAQMKDIAESVGMSRHTIYRYYQDKFDLGFAILESVLLRWRDQNLSVIRPLLSDRTTDALSRVDRLIRSTIMVRQEDAQFRFVAQFDTFVSSDRAPVNFREHLEESIGLEVFVLMEELVRQGQADGSIRTDKSARLLILVLTESLVALQHRLVLRGNQIIQLESDEVEHLAEESLDMLISGLAAKQ